VLLKHWLDPSICGAGFSLIEAVVAGAMLLMTVTAVTTCVVVVSANEVRVGKTMDIDRAVHQVGERLRRLPFCAAAYPAPGVPSGDAAGDLVAAVFPHADVRRNEDSARYVASASVAGDEPGSFVSTFLEDGVTIRCVAHFVRGASGPAIEPAELTGWDVARSAAPPGAALSIVLSADAGSVRRLCFVREAAAKPAQDAGVSGGT
jgi:hypothetical protein